MADKFVPRDKVLDWLAFFLSIVGILMVFDTCALDRSTGDHNIFMRAFKQLIITLGCYVGYLYLPYLAAKKDLLRIIKIWTFPVAGVCLLILGLVALTGDEINGAARWLSIGGMVLQPSELFKPVFCLLLAWYISEFRKAPFSARIIGGALLVCMAGAVGASNMSTGILYVAVLVLSLLVGGMPAKWFWGLVLAGAVGALLVLQHGDGFRQMRIAAWLDPVAYASQEGDQIVKSLAAIASAGFLGCGFGNGNTKYIIPEPSNDYIFTTIAEEFGCLGCIVVIGLYFLLLLKAADMFLNCRTRYCRVIVFSASFFMLLQAYLNIAVTLYMLPSTGVCLHLISYGGSSVIRCYALFTLMQIASMHRNRPYKDFRLYVKRRPVYQKLKPASGGRRTGAYGFGGGFASGERNEG
ncbi:MAG: FtsW/RodA/SpoVE family cell cycle protein [Abditibacteriota bacterium]|nr:FtsW/RodA/SpoVE family cell cycle protein [Abditibacteriota bacterium]